MYVHAHTHTHTLTHRVRTLWGSWQKCYTVLVDSTLQFYSIHKVVKKTPEAKPQYTFFLRHATVTPYTKEKRKNVFQVANLLRGMGTLGETACRPSIVDPQ